MDILTRLNKTLEAYRPPKLNWLTKKPVLCHCVYFVYAGALMLCAGAFLALLTLFSTPNFINFFVLILLCFTVVFALIYPMRKYLWPKNKEEVKSYTNIILKVFPEKEYQTIKIQLLKILNNEPYIPVFFFGKMFAIKRRFDQQQKRQKDKACFVPVEKSSDLTVLIEKMEEQVDEEETNNKTAREKHIESISKL